MEIYAEVWPRRTKLSRDYSYTDTFIGDTPEGVRFIQKLNQGKKKRMKQWQTPSPKVFF